MNDKNNKIYKINSYYCNRGNNRLSCKTGLKRYFELAKNYFISRQKQTTLHVEHQPKEIFYRDYKKFDLAKFKHDLKSELDQSVDQTCGNFEEQFLKTLENHAPTKKKVIRSNQATYVTKALRKAIMRRSELLTKYHRTKKKFDEISYKKQKNFVSRLYKKERRTFYKNFNIKNISDNKDFWKAVKPFLSNNVSTEPKLLYYKEMKLFQKTGTSRKI